jgi:superoxide reductase
MLNELLQTADWKTEKHVPVIDAPDMVKSGEVFEVNVSLGREVAHPNTTAHHIGWIALYFKPEGGKFPYEVGRVELSSHGASTDGPDESGVYTHHGCTFHMKTAHPGELMAMAHCNIHGLWQSSNKLSLE